MAHLLDRNTVTGRLAYFGVGQSPWHAEGFTLDTPPTFTEALRLAGSDFDVALRSLEVAMPDGSMQLSPMGKATVRLDRSTILGIVGDDYRPIQNRDAFRVLEPLIDSGVATIETGGTLREGADCWFLVKFNIDDAVVCQVFTDEVIPYACIVTNHTGRRKVVCMETPIRVVCANTLGMALGKNGHAHAVAVSHRGDGGAVRMIEAAQSMFGGIMDRYHGLAEAYATLKANVLTVEQFTASVLNVAAPMPTDDTAPRYKTAVNRSLDRRNAISSAWDSGKGHTGDHSAWEAYNAAVEVIDHDPELYRVRGSRVASMMDGTIHSLKTDVLTSLLETVTR